MSNLSFVTHEGDGATVMFPIAVAGENIGYFRTSDIHVYVDGVEVSFTIDPNSPHLVVLSSAPADGSEVLIRRIMPKDSTYANFERGNNFGQRQVNNSFLQQLYTTQELLDGFWPEGYYWKQNVNAGGKLLKNLGDAVDPDDAVKKEVTDSLDERVLTLEEGILGDSRYVHFLYNNGSAIGGEISITIPFNFTAINTVHINGVRQTYGLAFDYNTSTNEVEFAEQLEQGDEVVISVGKDPVEEIPSDLSSNTATANGTSESNTLAVWFKKIVDFGKNLFSTIGGSTERSLEERFDSMVDPKDFGVVADGVTDDSAAMLIALQYAKDNNKEVYIHQNYKIRMTVPIPLWSGIVLKGANGSERDATQRSVIKNSVTDMFTYPEEITDLRFEGVTFIGGSSNHLFEPQTTSGYFLKYSDVIKCGIEGFVSHFDGVWTAVNWNNNWQGGSRGSSMVIRGADSNFKDNFIDTPHLAKEDYVVQILSVSKTNVLGNFITGQTAMPMLVRGNRGGSGSKGNIIAFNRFEAPTFTSIKGSGLVLQELESSFVGYNWFFRCLSEPFGVFTGFITCIDCRGLSVKSNIYSDALTSFAGNAVVKVLQSSHSVYDMDIGDFIKYNVSNSIPDILESGTVSLHRKTEKVLFERELNTDVLSDSLIAGESSTRFQVRADGRFDWGGGASGKDVSLYRDRADVLRSNSTIKPKVSSTRPLASDVGIGANMFDSSLGKPIWSDGTNWVDASGTVV